MSTEALHEALDWLENYLGHQPEAQDVRRRARAALKGIEKAAMDVSNNGSDGASVETFELFDKITEECARRPKVDAGPE